MSAQELLAAAEFSYVGAEWDSGSRTAHLHYALDAQPFVEQVELPADRPSEPGPAAVFDRVLEVLLLTAGISYYKAAAPARVVDRSGSLAPEHVAFWTDYYRDGLGEFSYVNRIDLSQRPVITPSRTRPAEPVADAELPQRTLVPVGGGKDSVVALELLRGLGEPITLFNVGGHRAALDTARVAGMEMLVARRRLDPRLMELNAQGALNGHVPVTAIVSSIALLTAAATGHDQVALANERSASEANLLWNGRSINHQHSKSLDFERSFSALLREHVGPSPTWFSALRPLSELQIAQRLAALPAYHPVVTSCNRAFRIDESKRVRRWCGDCPKCRFVFLALAPFLERERVVEIFEGRDLLADESQLPGFLALLAEGADKPFECVGEEQESRVAFSLLAEQPGWSDAPVVRAVADRLPPASEEARAEVLRSQPELLAPGRLRERLADAV